MNNQLVSLDTGYLGSFVSKNEVTLIKEQIELAKKTLTCGTAEGNDFLGWIDLPSNYDKDEFARIKKAADKIKNDSAVLVVIGIGGSYLGAKAAIEFLNHPFYNQLTGKKTPEIYFAGHNMSSDYIQGLIDIIGNRDFSVNVISKSGTTTEPAVAFRIFKELLEKKYGDKASERIYATTDKAKGALKDLANEKGYESFVVPDDVGGRFSVLTAVGLLPIAVSGADIDALMSGTLDEQKRCKNAGFEDNIAMQYAAYRNILLRKDKNIELLVNYDPALHFVSEWWKQLYGESEGKNKKGIFPAAVDFTTDLHSMGQYIQDGRRSLFETVIKIENSNNEIVMKTADSDTDGLNYLAGKSLDFINEKAMQGTILAHSDGDVPCMLIKMANKSAYCLGSLFYFFEFACGISGYVLGVNPFNQPGVEAYKQNMFALLGKKGYEDRAKSLLERI